MGKIVKFHRRTESESPQPSALSIALTSWLNCKPANTKRAYLNAARRWSEYLGAPLESEKAEQLWAKATYTSAQNYINQCAEGKAQPGRASAAAINGKVAKNTLRYRAVVLKTLYDELIAKDMLQVNPWIRVVADMGSADDGQRRPHDRIPIEHVKALTGWRPSGMGQHEEVRDLAVLCLLFMALRRSEVVSVRVGDVLEADDGTLYLRLAQTKAQKIQTVAVPEVFTGQVKAMLRQRLADGASSSEPFICIYYEAGAKVASDQWVYRLFKSYCKRFGIPDKYTPHCCRVTAVTQLLDQGYSHREVKELSRHASVAMVEKYDRKRVDVTKSVVKKLKYD